MQIFGVIEELCTDLLYNPGMYRPDTVENLSLAASLIQDDINCLADKWREWDSITAIMMIKERVAFCKADTQEIVYYLLIEIASEKTH